MPKYLLMAVAALALSGCSTLSGGGAAAPEPVPFNLAIQEVTGEATAASAPDGTVAALTDAIGAAVRNPPQDGPQANLGFVVSDYQVTGAGRRASHRMTLDVVVRTPGGKPIRDFTLTRSATTLGADRAKARKDSLISQMADSVARTLRGEK